MNLKKIFHKILEYRAQKLTARILPYLPQAGSVLDLGSGTGHNACALKQKSDLALTEVDVVDISTVGEGPVIFDGHTLPFANREFDCVMALFVLHYPKDILSLLQEMFRVSKKQIVIIQSTYKGKLGLAYLYLRELFQGRLAFYISKIFHLVENCECSLFPQRYCTREQLQELFKEANLAIVLCHPKTSMNLLVSRDLYVLEKEQ